jgi:hypothetical protein
MKNKLKKIIVILLLSVLYHNNISYSTFGLNNIGAYVKGKGLGSTMLVFGAIALAGVLIKNNFNDDDIDFFGSKLKDVSNQNLEEIAKREKNIKEKLKKAIEANNKFKKEQQELEKKKAENNKKLKEIKIAQDNTSKEKERALEKFSHEQQKKIELKIANLNKELNLLQSKLTSQNPKNLETKSMQPNNIILEPVKLKKTKELVLSAWEKFKSNITNKTPFSYQQIISQNK